jgi:hypothetical protein
MLTYRKNGLIQVRVGVLDKRCLTITTNLLFGIEGYSITYTLEESFFVPAPPPLEDHDHVG